MRAKPMNKTGRSSLRTNTYTTNGWPATFLVYTICWCAMTWLTGIPSGWRRCAIGTDRYRHLSIVLDTLIAGQSRLESGVREKHFDLTPLSLNTNPDTTADKSASTTVEGQDFIVPCSSSPGYGFELQDYFQGDPTTFFHLNTKEEGVEFKVYKKGPPLGVRQGRPPSEVATHDVELLRGHTFPNDTLYTRGYDESTDFVTPSALGHLVAFVTALATEQTDAIYSQIIIWDYVSDEIVVKIPITVTSAYKQEDDDHADLKGLKLPIYDEEPDDLDCTFLTKPHIYDCWSIRLLSDSRILVTGRNECVKFNYAHDDYTISSAYIFSFAKNRWTLDKMMPVSCETGLIDTEDETTGGAISQADVYIDKDEQTTTRLFGLIDTFGQETWTNTLRIVDEDRYLNDLGDRAQGFHSEYPRGLGDFGSVIEKYEHYRVFDCPYIAGWRAVCGSGHPVKLSANLDGEPAAGMRWTDILYYDFCPHIATKIQALPDSIKSHVRIHVQQAPYVPKDYDRYYIDGIHKPAQNDRFAAKGIGITVDTQYTKADNDRPRLPFLQIRVQTFRDMPNLDVKSITIWQGGLVLLGEKESLILYFDDH